MPDPERRVAAAQALRAWCGLVVTEARLPALERELTLASGVAGPDEGLRRFLAGEPALRTRLARSVATPETSLFRHPGHFRLLADVVARCREARRPCRVLSAGCSTGEEAWSAGAVLAAASTADVSAGTVTGWDLLDERVARAATGQFGPWASRNGTLGYDRFFATRDGRLEATAALRRHVEFEPMNLLAIPEREGRRFDVIFFRNVCIYWDAETTARVVGRLLALLAPDGALFVGPCDPVTAPDERWAHEIVDGVRRIRARAADARPRAPTARAPAPRPATPAPAPPRPATPKPLPTRLVSTERPAPRLQDTFERVREYADRGDYAGALALLDANRAEPTPDEFKWRGILALNLGDPNGAVTALRCSAFLAPQDAEVRRWLAVAHEAAGSHPDAARELRNAQEIDDADRLR